MGISRDINININDILDLKFANFVIFSEAKQDVTKIII